MVEILIIIGIIDMVYNMLKRLFCINRYFIVSYANKLSYNGSRIIVTGNGEYISSAETIATICGEGMHVIYTHDVSITCVIELTKKDYIDYNK